MTEEDLLATLSEEEYNELVEAYGDLSEYIKSQTQEYKVETTNEMDRIKKLFFICMITGVTYSVFKDKLDKEFENKTKIDNKTERGFETVTKMVGSSDGKIGLNEKLYEIYKQFEIDMKSTKKADDKYVRVIADYYRRSKDVYDKEWVDKEEYLTGLVKRYDKVEKVIAYRNKDGSVRAYFDIASYDSMVYNTNLTNTGVRESIKDAIRRGWDIAYIDPHLNSCPLCQEFQGRFISLSGESVGQFFNGQLIRDSLESAKQQGFLHPNCTHVPRKAYAEDRVDMKWNNPESIEMYEIKQKINALNLKKSRLRNDMSIYKEIGNEEAVDKTKDKIKSINKKIKELKDQT